MQKNDPSHDSNAIENIENIEEEKMLDSQSVQIQSAKVLDKTETELFEPKSADEDDADFTEAPPNKE